MVIFNCLNCFYLFRTKKSNLQDIKILEFNQYQKSGETHLLFMQILIFFLKNMDVKVILKNHQQQK